MMRLYIPQSDGTFVEHNFDFVEDYVKVESKAPVGTWMCSNYASIRLKLSHYEYSRIVWVASPYMSNAEDIPTIPETLRAYLFLVHNQIFE